MINKFLAALPGIMAVILCAGCERDVLPTRGEIDEYQVMRVIGVDRSADNPATMELTFVTEKSTQTKSGDTSGGGTKEYEILSSSGPTLFEAERVLKTHSDKKQFFGYVDYIIVGEEAAKDDFSKYFDYITRDHEIRFSPKVFISKGSSAKEFLLQTTSVDKFIVDRLDNVRADIMDLSNYKEVTINEVAGMLDYNTSAGAVIPVLKCGEIRNERMIGGILPEKDTLTCGYAVLKDYKLAGYIDEPISRGYNFLMSKVKSTPVSVTDSTGKYVGLEVINETTKIFPHFSGDTLEGVTYMTHIYANVSEQHSRSNIYAQADLDRFKAGLAEVIKNEMKQVIDKSKEFGVDCTELGDMIRIRHPYKWEKIRDHWKTIYPGLNINVQVSADIRRTYDIEKPNGVEET